MCSINKSNFYRFDEKSGLGNGLKAEIIAVLFSALFFGYRRYYQGMHGALITGVAGLFFAL